MLDSQKLVGSSTTRAVAAPMVEVVSWGWWCDAVEASERR